LEKKIYRNAGLIISLSPDIQNDIYKKINSVPNIVVPNFVDEEMFKSPENRHLTTEDRRHILQSLLQDSNDRTVVNGPWSVVCSYIGTAGIANDLMQMVELARLAEKSYPEMLFLMMIEGMEEEKIRKNAPNNMFLIPYGGKEKVAEVLAVTDYNFVCYAQYPLLGTGSPNKFFDGLAAGCVTVINVKGWISDLLDRNASGLFWDINNHIELLDRINEDLNNGKFVEMKKKSVQLAEQFDKDLMCTRIVRQIEWKFG
jgi:hypothetical protein